MKWSATKWPTMKWIVAGVLTGSLVAQTPDASSLGSHAVWEMPKAGGIATGYRTPRVADVYLEDSIRLQSLFRDGKTVGRHYAGPTWEIGESIISGTVTGRAPGATAKDIPWLKLHISNSIGDPNGPLEDVTTVQRINTKGGNLEGACDKAGELSAEPYSADYIFLEKTP